MKIIAYIVCHKSLVTLYKPFTLLNPPNFQSIYGVLGFWGFGVLRFEIFEI